MSDPGYEAFLAYRELDKMPDPSINPCEWVECEVALLRSIVRKLHDEVRREIRMAALFDYEQLQALGRALNEKADR